MTRLRAWLRYVLKARETWRVLAHDFGWRRSFEERRSVDAHGEPIPWYSYPAIEFLRTLDLNGKRVFEFGSGNSSVFWARKADSVLAVENDGAWAAIVQSFAVPNLRVIEETDRDRYVSTPEREGGGFDVVVVDGRYRRRCAAAAARVVKAGGFIVFDNADWYPDACSDLRAQGWVQIDFSGFGPVNSYCWTTAVFLRAELRIPRAGASHPIGGIPALGEGESA